MIYLVIILIIEFLFKPRIDITKDKKGNIYIGDFGNNANERKDLCIYKVAKNELSKENAVSEYKIFFSYPEQTEFPPKKKEMFYDVEGFFEYKNHFYLFSLNCSFHRRKSNHDCIHSLLITLNKFL